MDVDYITYPKDGYRSVNYSGTNTAIASGKDAADGNYRLRQNISQKAWSVIGAEVVEESNQYPALTVQSFEHVPTYFSMRGAR